MSWNTVVAWFEETTGRARRRRLEEELVRADAEIARLRALLADATRPPTQFARMREREVAVQRLARLRMAREGRRVWPSRDQLGAGRQRDAIARP